MSLEPRQPAACDERAAEPAVLGAEDVAPGEHRLGVTVRRGCGSVEVRVSGPLATLTLFFDSAGLQWSDIRCAVRAALERYGSSLLGDPGRPACHPRGESPCRSRFAATTRP